MMQETKSIENEIYHKKDFRPNRQSYTENPSVRPLRRQLRYYGFRSHDSPDYLRALS